LHLNQATAQPHYTSLINATTDHNNGINGNVFNPSISIWHEEMIVAQAIMELDSGASVEPFSFPDWGKASSCGLDQQFSNCTNSRSSNCPTNCATIFRKLASSQQTFKYHFPKASSTGGKY
jgi:hypothetical protein